MRPLALKHPECEFAIDRMDLRMNKYAGSPIRRLLLSRAKKTDEPASNRPIATDAMPSIWGYPKATEANVEIAAIRMPMSAMLSTNSVINDGGSLLSLIALMNPISPFTSLNYLSDTSHEPPSKTKARAKTT